VADAAIHAGLGVPVGLKIRHRLDMTSGATMRFLAHCRQRRKHE
jgi:hypothetical protein